MRSFWTDFSNDLFAVIVSFFLLIVATIVLMLNGDTNLAWLVSNLGTVLVLGAALLLYSLGKPRWVSSDWLVNILVAHKLRKGKDRNLNA